MLHWDHIEYFQRAAAKHGRLYIGLTALGRDRAGQSAREASERNPLTFWERVEMWRVALDELANGVEHVVGPFPIERPDLLPDYVPRTCVCATTVRDEWNNEKVQRLSEAGYRVDVLFTDYDKALSGTDVRGQIASGSNDWVASVPPSVADYLTRLDLGERLRRLAADADIANAS